MFSQLLLPDMPSTPMGNDRLFIAAFPDVETSLETVQVAHQLRFKHGLVGRPIALDRFHVTLAHLGDFVGVPKGIVAAVNDVIASVAAKVAPFETRFDFAESFARNPGNRRPLVLRQEHEDAHLKNLLLQLLTALGMLSDGSSVKFVPHMTLLYDEKSVSKEQITPITWTVDEIVLVHSLVGQSRYIPLGRWKLVG